MRKLIVLVAIAASLYGGYWFVGRSQVDKVMVDVLAGLDEGPASLDYSDIRTRGFPSRFDTTISDLVYTDPTSGITWSAPFLQIFALAYRPNEVITVFPNEQTFTVAGREFTLFSNDMRASGKVRATPALAFQNATVAMDNPRLRTPDGSELAMANLLVAMRLTPDTTQTYDLFLEARSTVLPEALRALIDPDGLQPPVIQNLRFDSDVTLAKPIELNGTSAPQTITAFSLTEFSLNWGDIALSAIGDLAPDRTGILDGSITLTARNWRQVLDFAVNAGVLSDSERALYTTLAANLDSTPQIEDTLTLTLSVDQGIMKLGDFPIGQSPVIP